MRRLALLALAFCAPILWGCWESLAQNTAPQFVQTPADTNIVESTTLVVTNSAFDAETPTNRLNYTLQNPPSGATIDANGVIRWTPSEAQGPSTNTFTTLVFDDATPPLFAMNSFKVTVSETNRPPFLPFQSDKTVAVGSTLTVTNTANDFDIPSNTIGYQLQGSPSGMTIDGNGIISWTPTAADAGSSNLVTTVATDNGAPPLSATNSFTVLVTATNTPALHTNIVYGVNVALAVIAQNHFLVQGTTNTFYPTVLNSRLATKDVITAIASSIDGGTNKFTGAKLILKVPDVGTAQQRAFFGLRVGTTDTEIPNSVLSFSTLSEGSTISDLRPNKTGALTNGVDYTVSSFTLNTTTTQFQVQGLGLSHSASVTSKNKIVTKVPLPVTLSCPVSGSGFVPGHPAVFRGTVSLTARKIETSTD